MSSKDYRDRQQGRGQEVLSAIPAIPAVSTETNFKKMQQRFPGRALEAAVKGMLPKGPLGYAMLKKLKCYAGDQHPHTAQQPKALEI